MEAQAHATTTRQSKIRQVNGPLVRRKQEVVELDIAVSDTKTVAIRYGVDELKHNPRNEFGVTTIVVLI